MKIETRNYEEQQKELWMMYRSGWGVKLGQERGAVQLGLRGETLKRYGREWIVSIEDISAFVAEQRAHVQDLPLLKMPSERVYPLADEEAARRLRIDWPVEC